MLQSENLDKKKSIPSHSNLPTNPPIKKTMEEDGSLETQKSETSPSPSRPHMMRVRKRDGSLTPVDVMKIIERVSGCCQNLNEVDPLRVATKAISGLYDGATTKELDELAISTASLLISEEPEYSRLAARLLNMYMDEDVRNIGINSFADSIKHGYKMGLIDKTTYEFVEENKQILCASIESYRSDLFEYFGLKTIFDRYLLKNPESRTIIENPQYFFMRVACGLSQNAEEAINFYRLISAHDYMPSTPTLFNSATCRPQMSSCYLLDSPKDSLKSIYDKYTDIALLSKFAGGIGVSFSRVRSRGSLIQGTNGHSNGVVPWLKTLDSSVAAVNQGGKRKGACCVYLESWHADIEEFLELRDNTGGESFRTHNLNISNWVPDLFMKRVESGQMWSLFDPKKVPHFPDLFGEKFEAAYAKAEEEELFTKQIPARDLYGRMMKTLAQTGNGWMNFKDHANKKANQTAKPENIIHLSNLCTEILEVTSSSETAVCNLGSVNLARHVQKGKFDFKKLAQTVKIAVKYLDRVVDINFYPISTASKSNHKWRPVGLGYLGLQDVFFQLGLPFDSPEAQELSKKIAEEIYYHALKTSCELAKKLEPHTNFADTRLAQGDMQFDLWGLKPKNSQRWEDLRKDIQAHGVRNSLLIAIAPTATIASIMGHYEATEPQISNLFKRETLSGEFMQINKYLVTELKEQGLWNENMRNKIKLAEGSIAGIKEIPENIRQIYRTAWELPMKELIDMAKGRGAFIDQSQSLNLFIENPSIGKLSSMYMYAWKQGIKTTYYLRSRPATRIRKTTTHEEPLDSIEITHPEMSSTPVSSDEQAAVACSLENPEACEVCQ